MNTCQIPMLHNRIPRQAGVLMEVIQAVKTIATIIQDR